MGEEKRSFTIKQLAEKAETENFEYLATEEDILVLKKYLMLDSDGQREVAELVDELAENLVIIDELSSFREVLEHNPATIRYTEYHIADFTAKPLSIL